MRCVCCNNTLSDYESTRRHGRTGEFLDTCNQCFKFVQETVPSFETNDRKDLVSEGDIEELFDNYEEPVYDNFKDYNDEH